VIVAGVLALPAVPLGVGSGAVRSWLSIALKFSFTKLTSLRAISSASGSAASARVGGAASAQGDAAIAEGAAMATRRTTAGRTIKRFT
jgi:hypothetical protein